MKKINIFVLFCLCSTQLFGQATIFADDFETAKTWTIFEELVSGNPCYANNIGEVARSTDVAHIGTNALRVWANKSNSNFSNHVIAAHHISNTNGTTGQLRYGMWAYMATDIDLTQSCPEFSVQSTRTVGAQNLTYIAGIQYIGNKWVTDKWNIWHNGTWKTIKLSEFGTKLAANTWYYLELNFNMTTNIYTSFKIQGGGLNVTLDLTQAFQNAPLGFQIGGEARSWTPSLFVTAESENLWSGCMSPYQNKVYYDDLLLESVTVLPLELLDFQGFAEKNGNRMTWQFADTKDLDNLVIEKSKDGLNFTATSGSSYRMTKTSPTFNAVDEKPFDVTYYRLKIKDLDGKMSYSKIISISKKENSKLKVYPSITSDFLMIETEEISGFYIYNLLGQTVLSGQTARQINVSTLPEGTYLIQIGSEQSKFVKI